MANAFGYVTTTDTGYEVMRSFVLLTLCHPFRIVVGDRKTRPSQPDFRVLAGSKGAEIGAGWRKTAESSGKDYLSLTLADPAIGQGNGCANLAPVKDDDDRFVLLWNPK